MRLALFVIGSGIGAPARYLIDKYFRSRFSFPYGILIVNVIGSFILGLVVSNTKIANLYLILGFCGAFTSWSALALDYQQDLTNKKYFQLLMNLLSNIVFGLFAAFIGMNLF
jgi:CrcB protein